MNFVDQKALINNQKAIRFQCLIKHLNVLETMMQCEQLMTSAVVFVDKIKRLRG